MSRPHPADFPAPPRPLGAAPETTPHGTIRWTHGTLLGVLLLHTLLAAPVDRISSADTECSRWRRAFAEMPVRTLRVSGGSSPMSLRVKAADTAERQAGGFQCATRDEIQGHLILFDFGHEILTQFHMQNVPAPLDIAFAKADGRIFAILRMEPSATALYGPMGSFRYALEARAGFFAERGIRAGAARLAGQSP